MYSHCLHDIKWMPIYYVHDCCVVFISFTYVLQWNKGPALCLFPRMYIDGLPCQKIL